MLRPDPSGVWTIHVSEDRGAERRIATLPPVPLPGHSFYTLSSTLIRESTGAWIIGITREAFPDDPRGYASARYELLFWLAPGSSEAVELLDLPVAGSVTTRYCSRGDLAHPPTLRCVVDHTISGVVHFDFDNPAGPPRFILNARAEIFPGRPVPPSTPGGTVTHLRDRDPSCTYHRIFTRDAATGRYAPDAPLPDCARYFELDRWREWVTDVLPREPKANSR